MTLEMIFNELSLFPPASIRQIARQWMANLVDVIRIAIDEYGVDDILRIHSKLYDIPLSSDGYQLFDWLGDNQIDLETRQLLQSLISKVPFTDDLQDPQLEHDLLLTEFYYQEIKTLNLGLAYLLGALAISVNSQLNWQHHKISLKALKLEDDGNFSSAIIDITHASQIEHIQQHTHWITERLKEDVRDGKDLWQRRDRLFPNLTFCRNVKEQLDELNSGNRLLHPVVKQLFEFEKYCKTWIHGPFDKNRLPGHCSGESEPTLAKYSKERTFLCPDDEWRLFELHAKLGLNYWRIHFIPQPQTNTIIIGYIGLHLPTAKG